MSQNQKNTKLPPDSQVVIAWPKGEYRPCLAVYEKGVWFEINAKNQMNPFKDVDTWVSIDDAKNVATSSKDPEAYAIMTPDHKVIAILFNREDADNVLKNAYGHIPEAYCHPLHVKISDGFAIDFERRA